jgi:cation transport ATPase
VEWTRPIPKVPNTSNRRRVTRTGLSRGGQERKQTVAMAATRTTIGIMVPGDHDKHAGHSVEMFHEKFWGTLMLSIPTLVWAPMIQHWFGYEAPGGPRASRWIPAIFGTLVFGYGGWVFIKGAAGEIRDRLPGMMTLISLAISVAFVFSLAVTFGFPGSDLWWELATLVTIMVLGHWIEMRSISQAQGAVKELAKLLPDTAVRVVDDRTETVPISELRDGNIVLVRPGASIPADGAVREGSSDVNESMIAGESRPVRKESGAKVIAGTINGPGSLRVEVTGTGERTALAGIMRLVAQAQSSRSRAQALADRAAFLLTIVAITAAAVTGGAWSIAGRDASFVIERVVTVLVIACARGRLHASSLLAYGTAREPASPRANPRASSATSSSVPEKMPGSGTARPSADRRSLTSLSTSRSFTISNDARASTRSEVSRPSSL